VFALHRSNIPPRWNWIGWPGFLLAALACLAAAGSLRAAQSVTLAWDPVVDLDLAGYKLYYGTSRRSYDQIVDVRNFTTNTVDTLQEGTTYFFAVVAYNTVGLESDYSNEVSYTPPPPGVPTILSVDHFETYVVVKWASVSGKSYRVLYKNRLEDAQWTDASGTITAVGPESAWADSQVQAAAQRFYAIEVLSP
jgi:hypothetical protein